MRRLIKSATGRIRGMKARLFHCMRPVLLWSWWRTWKTLPVLHWIAGAEYFKAGDFRAAAESYRRGIEKFPRHRANFCARLDYAYCLFQLNSLSEAMAELRKVVVQEPGLKDSHLLLAKLQLYTGQAVAAARTMRRALDLFESDTQVILCFAHCVIAAKGPSSQLVEVREKLRALRSRLDFSDPYYAAVDAAIACYEFRFGDGEFADQLLVRVIASGGAPFEAFVAKGERLLDGGRTAQARDQFERAMCLVPQDPRPLTMLARCYLADGDLYEPEHALQLGLMACSRSHYENPEALSVLADAYAATGDAQAAMLISARMKALTSTRQINFDYLRRVEQQLQRLRSVKLPTA
jgi:predicted Zn-dependent protease